jgi:hypothetical protein
MSEDEDDKQTMHLYGSSPVERPGIRYVFSDAQPTASVRPSITPRELTSADLRNAMIDAVIRELETMGKRFREDDPVRDALTACRRQVAKHFVAPTPPDGGGIKVIK